MENSMSRERGMSYMVLVGLQEVRERERGEGVEREGERTSRVCTLLFYVHYDNQGLGDCHNTLYVINTPCLTMAMRQ